MAFVFRPKRRVGGRIRVGRTYVGQYRLAGDLKATRVPLRVSDKQVAEEKLRRIVQNAEREREGLSPPKEQRDAAKRPIESFVGEYMQSRRGLNRDAKYVSELGRKILRLVRECGWSALADVTAHSFEAWRAGQPRLTAKTLNEYRNAIFGLCEWTRVGQNPIRLVEKVRLSQEPKRARRALTADQLQTLAAVSGERGILYVLAACTGIRRGELEQIEWRDLHLDGARPFITVRASTAKNDKLVRQPLPPSVVAILRRFRPINAVPTDLAFKRLMPRMKRYRDDLKAAGIPFVDEKNEYADFHALRKTFGTELAKAGVPFRVAMELMRHSDPNLTAKTYTDAGMLPVWDAVAGLALYRDTQIDTLKIVDSGQAASLPVPTKGDNSILLTAGEQMFSPSESASVPVGAETADGARCRVRTCDFLRVKQALYH